MYETYTRQALPQKDYRELLGSAICVFNSNNSFIIENFLRESNTNETWYTLIEMTSGKLASTVKDFFVLKDVSNKIYNLFVDILERRNRIMHSFQITAKGEQILATKDRRTQDQFNITRDYRLEFIELNNNLSSLLHQFRGI